MNIFFDTSVILAACSSRLGASRAIFDYQPTARWRFLIGSYELSEVARNLPRFRQHATEDWKLLRPQIQQVRDVVTYRHSLSPLKPKDIPVLVTALAWADVLLTMDEEDFGRWIGQTIDGLRVLKPAAFLREEREKGNI